MEIITDVEKLVDRCDEVDVRKDGKEVQKIVLALKKVIREKGLKGLSANQLGFDKRIFVLAFGKDLRSFINPIITSVKGITLSREKCSSLNNKEYIRVRNTEIMVAYQTPLGKIETQKLVGLAAIMFQHHNDHLDGMLLSDVGLEIDEAYDNATDEERRELITAYMDSLDLATKEMQEEIKNDKDLNEAYKAVEFLEKVKSGEVTLEGTTTRKKNNS